MLTLEQILDKTAKHAVEKLVEHGKLELAGLLGFTDNDDLTYFAVDMPPPFKDERSKMALKLHLALRKGGITRYGWLSEVWLSSDRHSLAEGVEPRHAPDRRDGLHTMACSADRVLMRVFVVNYHEKMPKVTLSKQSDADTSDGNFIAGGRWTTLLAPDFDPRGHAFIGNPKNIAKARAELKRDKGMIRTSGRA